VRERGKGVLKEYGGSKSSCDFNLIEEQQLSFSRLIRLQPFFVWLGISIYSQKREIKKL
jgi:hypothetical protein